jgi:hypothetical protein
MKRALHLAESGFYVFPLRPGEKRPAMKFTKWERRATRDRELIVRWWKNTPHNIGVACGPSKLLVVDCDTGEGEDGLQVLTELVKNNGHELPATLTVRTATGGTHLYFTAPENTRLGNSAGKLGRKIDTRGIGGYVVAAGSVRPEGYYTVMSKTAVAPLPGWIAEALAQATFSPTTAELTTYQASRYLDAILREEARRVAEALPGTRNNTLNAAAFVLGQLVAGGEVPEHQACAILLYAAGRHVGIKGFTQSEMSATMRSGLTAGMRHPRRLTVK